MTVGLPSMKHIVLYAMRGWGEYWGLGRMAMNLCIVTSSTIPGHMKPLFSLIIRMAEAREDVIMTFLIDEKFDKVMGELAKLSDQRLKAIEDRIQCVVCCTLVSICSNPDKIGGFPSNLHSVIDMRGNLHHSSLNSVIIDHSTGLYSAFKALYLSESLTCKTSGKVIEGLPRPTIAIIDVKIFLDREGVIFNSMNIA